MRLSELGRDQLASAWRHMQAGLDDPLAGGEALRRFAHRADHHLDVLADQLVAGSYRPGSIQPVAIPKPAGGMRHLAIPTVRDRVLERAILELLTPAVDPLIHDAAHAYRPGRGVHTAVQELARQRDEESGVWVTRADLADCFETLPAHRIPEIISAVVDADLSHLIGHLLHRWHRPGIPQGSPLSPLWCNLLLEPLDRELTLFGVPIIRYADDIAVTNGTIEEAHEALDLIRVSARHLGMSMADKKCAIDSFANGFVYLGQECGPKYPVSATRMGRHPERSIYVGVQGSRVRVARGRVLVDPPESTVTTTPLLDVPSRQVARLVTLGAVAVSAGARSWALGTGVDIVHLSRRGGYLGQTVSAAQGLRADRVRAQLRAADSPEVSLPLARSIVAGKLLKQRIHLQRLSRRSACEPLSIAIDRISAGLSDMAAATSLNMLRGHEGAGAHAYFQGLSYVVPPEMGFTRRTRRPSTDIINTALSYGYAILLGEATAALCASGLEPAFGILHADCRKRPGLALDLMEEFRPWVVDQSIITAVRRKELRAEHATRHQEGAVLLTAEGKNIVISNYENRMNQTTKGALSGFSGTIRQHLILQAHRLARYFGDPRRDPWTPLSWRA